MKAQISEAGVPFVITYRKVIRRPKLSRERKFVGPFQLMKNVLVKAIEMVEDIAFETKTEFLDPGQSIAVHWAVDVEDPWDTTAGCEKNLVAYRILGDNRPTSGAHFEIFAMPPKESEEKKEKEETVEEEEQPKEPAELTPEQWALESRNRRIREAAQQGTGSPVNGRRRARLDGLTAPVVDAAYEPRRVRTLEEEITAEVVEETPSEEPEDLDRAGGLGEDD